MKRQLEQAISLNGLIFDALDVVDVKEVILVVVDEVAFHLRRTHSAIRLRNVNHWKIQVREDIDAHPPNRQNGTEGDSDYEYKNRGWTA